jgi:hypothetical protein
MPKVTELAESAFISNLMEAILGRESRLAILGRGYYTSTPESRAYWAATLRDILWNEWRREELKAQGRRGRDADRGICASATFRLAEKAKAKLERFGRELAAAKEADAKAAEKAA